MSTSIHLNKIPTVHHKVRPPGSKSISNRALLLAALANGTSYLRYLLESDDTRHMLEALKELGIQHRPGKLEILRPPRNYSPTVLGCNGNIPNKGSPEQPVELFLGNAGTAFRFLTAVLAFAGGYYQLSGVSRMHQRPIKDLVDALRQLGCEVRYLENEGYPPLGISPAKPLCFDQPISIRGDVSSQFLSALLMALPLALSQQDKVDKAVIKVVGEFISRPYVEMTCKLMRDFFAITSLPLCMDYIAAQGQPQAEVADIVVNKSYYKALNSPQCFTTPPQVIKPIFIESDASSASYFLAAGALAGDMKVRGVRQDSIQGDVMFTLALQKMGVEIEYGDETGSYVIARRPKSSPLRALADYDCKSIPDAAMTLAVLALFAEGTTTLRNIGSWRVKETDRIAAMATELTKLGAEVATGADWLRITPPVKLNENVAIDTYDDHRMAMCFSLVCLGDKGVPVTINHPECVNKTYPDYFTDFQRLGQP